MVLYPRGIVLKELYKETDLIYEGIATEALDRYDKAPVAKETDLIYEGIATTVP